MRQIRATYRPCREMRLCDDLRDCPVREQAPIGDIRQPVTSLRFVHIVSRDQKREPVGGQLVNLLPEFPPRFWVHPGRRLGKQEQFWLVNEAGCQCEPPLPASRQLTRQLLLALPKPYSLQTPFDGFAPVLHSEHAGDEVEILCD